MPYRTIKTIRNSKKRIYEAETYGSTVRLKIKTPPTKLAQRIRNLFFSLFGGRKK